MKKNDIVDLHIDSLAFGGEAVAHSPEGPVVFMRCGVPGSDVRVKITHKKHKMCQGIIEEILTHSPEEVAPVCGYFGTCGGCSHQNVSYEEQLRQKSQNVTETLRRIGKLEMPEGDAVSPILRSPLELHYRNKMEFSFSAERWLTTEDLARSADQEITDKHFAFGLHVPARFDKVLDIEHCLLQHRRADEVFELIRSAAIESGLPAYNQKTHEGFFRQMLIRYSFTYNQLMAMLIVTPPQNDSESRFLDYYRSNFAEHFSAEAGDSLLIAYNSTLSPVNIEETELVKGNDYITERILDIDYRISPNSFFQTNSSQLDRFISKITEFAAPEPNDVVWDLYCGAGSITLPASRLCKEIYGIELVENAINDAKENAARNGITNAKFYCEDLHKKQLPEMLFSLPQPDIIIVDPPRAGMHKNVVNHINTVLPRRLVYVSCNPSTQARDLELLKDSYRLCAIQPVDLFPHTYHVESICRLERIDNARTTNEGAEDATV